MENKEHVLLCIVGKSAVGKDSLIAKVCERTNLKPLVSYTTRQQRPNERNTHIFSDIETYEQMTADGLVATYTEIAGVIYWVTINQLYENDLYAIDPIGLSRLKALDLPNIRFVTVYIKASDKDREFRAEKRGDDKRTFRTRCYSENPQFREFVRNEEWDYSIDNSNFAKTYSVLRHISNIEGCWQNYEEGSEDLS